MKKINLYFLLTILLFACSSESEINVSNNSQNSNISYKDSVEINKLNNAQNSNIRNQDSIELSELKRKLQQKWTLSSVVVLPQGDTIINGFFYRFKLA